MVSLYSRLKKYSSGFTLIELLIVVAMVAILSSSTIALLAGRYQKGSEEQYMKDLKAYMRYVQYRAIERGVTHQLMVEGSGKFKSKADEKAEGLFEPVSDPFSSRLNGQTGFKPQFEDPEGVYFFPNGVTSRNRLTISKNKESIATMTVTNRIGNIRIERMGKQ